MCNKSQKSASLLSVSHNRTGSARIRSPLESFWRKAAMGNECFVVFDDFLPSCLVAFNNFSTALPVHVCAHNGDLFVLPG